MSIYGNNGIGEGGDSKNFLINRCFKDKNFIEIFRGKIFTRIGYSPQFMLFREQAYYRFIVKGYAFLFTREFSIQGGFLVGNIVGLKKIIICSTSLTSIINCWVFPKHPSDSLEGRNKFP